MPFMRLKKWPCVSILLFNRLRKCCFILALLKAPFFKVMSRFWIFAHAFFLSIDGGYH